MAIDPTTTMSEPDDAASPLVAVVEQAEKDVVPRETPDPPDRRKALVSAWCGRVKTAKTHWDKAFKRMLDDQDFCWGHQWSKNDFDKRYKANLTLRLVAQKVAFLYAKNPTAVARRRERMNATVWDESQTTLEQLIQAGGMMAMQAAQSPVGMMNPAMMAAAQQGYAIAQDALRVKNENAMLDKLGKTLSLLYGYQVDNQIHPFKQMMKMVVRRTVTCGVGYVKLGFERVMEKRPDTEKGIADASERLATLERLAADLADQLTDEQSQEAEQLRLLISDLSQQVDFVAHEGLTFDYPLPTNIIPDPKTIELRHFLGADWVAEQYILSPLDIQEIYGCDVGDSYTAYNRADAIRAGTADPVMMAQSWLAGTPWSEGDWQANQTGKNWERQSNFGCVWQIYCRKDGLVYDVCDGYPEFLREPASPEVYNERFWPWYPLIFNECDHESEIFPPSDVRIMRDMQMEYNRCREGLKEQRIAGRPFTAVVSGAMEEDDLNKITEREANAVIELNALQPNQDVKQLLQPFAGPGIDPNLYEVSPLYEDILRTTGIQEANLGGVQQDATATQSQIAEGSRMTSMGSNIDDLNDLLSELALNGGQILLNEMSKDQVETIVGVGAVWPEMNQQQIANDVLLEIEAGSMGRPNAAQEIANAQRLYPLLLQIPGIDPNFLAKDLIRRLDDRLDLTQAFKSQLPSIVAMNGMVRGQPGMSGPVAGGAQGPQGANNAAKPPPLPAGGAPDGVGQLTGAPPPGAPGASPAPGG